MQNEKYNGWTNYATWRVSLEMFSDWDMSDYGLMNAEECQSIAEDHIEFSSEPGFARDYARAFLSEVNWHEIVEHLNEEV